MAGARHTQLDAAEFVGLPASEPADPYVGSEEIDLTCMHWLCILICMRTTLNIDDRTFEKASALTGVKEKTALVRMGLEALISLESAKRLADLGGTERRLRPIRRRRP